MHTPLAYTLALLTLASLAWSARRFLTKEQDGTYVANG